MQKTKNIGFHKMWTLHVYPLMSFFHEFVPNRNQHSTVEEIENILVIKWTNFLAENDQRFFHKCDLSRYRNRIVNSEEPTWTLYRSFYVNFYMCSCRAPDVCDVCLALLVLHVIVNICDSIHSGFGIRAVHSYFLTSIHEKNIITKTLWKVNVIVCFADTYWNTRALRVTSAALPLGLTPRHCGVWEHRSVTAAPERCTTLAGSIVHVGPHWCCLAPSHCHVIHVPRFCFEQKQL